MAAFHLCGQQAIFPAADAPSDAGEYLLGIRLTHQHSAAPTGAAVITTEPGLRLIDTSQLGVVRALTRIHSDRITDVQFPNAEGSGAVLATVSRDGLAKIWDMRIGGQAESQIAELRVSADRENAEVWSVGWAANDSKIAVGSSNEVLVFDARCLASSRKASRKATPMRRFTGHSDIVTACQFHPLDSGLIVSGGDDGLIFAWKCEYEGRNEMDRAAAAASVFRDLGAEELEDESFADADGVVCVVANEENVRSLSVIGPDLDVIGCVSSTDTVRTWQCEDLTKLRRGEQAEVSCMDKVQGSEDGVEFGVRLGLDTSRLSAQGSGGGIPVVGGSTAVRDHPLLKIEDSSGFIIDTFYDSASERLFIAGGSVMGHILLFHANLTEVTPVACFVNHETSGTGHRGVVRGAAFARRDEDQFVLTVGEDGVLCQWRQEQQYA